MRQHTGIRRAFAALMSLLMLLTLLPVSAFAADQTITLSFGDVKWTDSDENLQDYSDVAGQKVLVVPIVAASSDGQPFNMGGCEFQVNFNANGKALVYKDIADEGCGVLGFVGSGKNFLSVSATTEANANANGFVKALFSDTKARNFSVENNQVIAKIIFWPDESGKTIAPQLSFQEGARVSAVDADKNPVPYTVSVGASVTADPYDGGAPAEKVKVTFDANGGAFSDGATTEVEIDKGATVTAPADPTRDGYAFNGWFTEKDGATAFDFSKAIDAATTVYAGWKEIPAEKVKVTFDANGGAFSDGATTEVEIDKGATVTAPADPTRDGYAFNGWFTEKDGATAFDFSKAIDAATTVYAGWKAQETPPVGQTITLSFGDVKWTNSDENLQDYSDVTGQLVLVVPIVATSSDGQPFNVGGCEFQVNFNSTALVYKDIADEGCGVLGFVGSGKNFLSVSATTEANANANGFVKALFSDTKARNFSVENNQVIAKIVFWPNESGKTVAPQLSFQEGARVSAVDADKNPVPYTVSASASVTADPYESESIDGKVKVTFDGNGGTPATTEVEIDKGATVTAPADPTRENYDFNGWFTAADAKTPFDFSKAIDAATTVYAGWKEIPAEKVKVTFDGNGGTPATTEVEIDKGATVTAPADPTRENYDFNGWFTAADAKTPFDFSKAIDADTPVYAGWKEVEAPAEKVKVTFDANGGVFGAPATMVVEIDKGATVAVPANPMRSGYNFIGWFSDKDATISFDFSKAIDADTPVYAGWKEIPAEKVKVTFDGNGGLPATTQVEIDKDATVTVPTENPTRDGYSFTGWFSEKAATNKFDFSKAVDANTTVYAGWSKNETPTPTPTPGGNGCYIATSVYGSYDCPEVWTLRRFRDDVLGSTWYGRLFIKAYYATSPTLVKWFGDADWFRNFWRDRLDDMVQGLQDDGFESTPYEDQNWRS